MNHWTVVAGQGDERPFLGGTDKNSGFTPELFDAVCALHK
jgi:hypothetical protein